MATSIELEKLFEECELEELQGMEKARRREIEEKKKLVKELVTTRYRDLVASAESIIKMKSIAQSLSSALDSIESQCRRNELLASAKPHPASPSPDARAGDDAPLRQQFLVASRLKTLVELPEHIWTRLESAEYGEAWRLYEESRRLYHEIPAHQRDTHPLLSRQWGIIDQFPDKIKTGACAILGHPMPSPSAVRGALYALGHSLSLFYAYRIDAIMHAAAATDAALQPFHQTASDPPQNPSPNPSSLSSSTSNLTLLSSVSSSTSNLAAVSSSSSSSSSSTSNLSRSSASSHPEPPPPVTPVDQLRNMFIVFDYTLHLVESLELQPASSIQSELELYQSTLSSTLTLTSSSTSSSTSSLSLSSPLLSFLDRCRAECLSPTGLSLLRASASSLSDLLRCRDLVCAAFSPPRAPLLRPLLDHLLSVRALELVAALLAALSADDPSHLRRVEAEQAVAAALRLPAVLAAFSSQLEARLAAVLDALQRHLASSRNDMACAARCLALQRFVLAALDPASPARAPLVQRLEALSKIPYQQWVRSVAAALAARLREGGAGRQDPRDAALLAAAVQVDDQQLAAPCQPSAWCWQALHFATEQWLSIQPPPFLLRDFRRQVSAVLRAHLAREIEAAGGEIVENDHFEKEEGRGRDDDDLDDHDGQFEENGRNHHHDHKNENDEKAIEKEEKDNNNNNHFENVQKEKEESTASPSEVLQHLFDLRFLQLVFAGEARPFGVSLEAALEALIDPIDLAFYQPFLKDFSLRALQRSSLLILSICPHILRLFDQLDNSPIAAPKIPHHLLTLAPAAPRFSLLPANI